MRPLILHIRASNFFGGPEKQIFGHIKSYRNADHVLLTFKERGESNELIDRCKEEKISVEIIETNNPFNPISILHIREVFKKIKPDIICSHGYKPSILSIIGKIGLKIPIIMFSRGHTGENFKVKIFEALELMSLHFADVVVSVSKGYADYLYKKRIPEKKIRVVENAIDIEKYVDHKKSAKEKRIEFGFSSNDFLIATAGRLSPEKAHDDLINAFSLIQPQNPNAHLLVMGDGPLYGYLEKLIKDKSVENVHLMGFRKDIDMIMPFIDLFVLPSLTEGLPNVVLEAFSCGKSVIATNVGGVPEVVDNGINGLIVESKRPDLLAEAIKKIILSEDLAHQMGKAGCLKVKLNFLFEAQSEKLEKIYYNVIKNYNSFCILGKNC